MDTQNIENAEFRVIVCGIPRNSLRNVQANLIFCGFFHESLLLLETLRKAGFIHLYIEA